MPNDDSIKSVPDLSNERKAFESVPDNDKEIEESGEPEEATEEDTEESTEENEEENPLESLSDDDDEESEEETEEDSDEDEDESEQLRSDSLYQRLKEANPKIFKEIPELKHVIFREQEYTRLFPTVEAAKDAAENLEVFSDLQDQVLQGNPDRILKSLQKSDPEALQAFIGNFGESVRGISRDLYLGMAIPFVKEALRAAVRSGNKDLEASARNLNWFIFQTTDVEKDEGGFKPSKKEEAKDTGKERELEREKKNFQIFSKNVGTEIERRVQHNISKVFENSGLSKLLINSLTKEIFSRVDEEISADARHMGNIDNLWKQARSAGFTRDWEDRLINTYLSRAKLAIPKIRQKVLAESKLGIKPVTGDGAGKEKKVKRIPASNFAGNTNKPSGKIDVKKIDFDKVSERELFDGKVAYKKG